MGPRGGAGGGRSTKKYFRPLGPQFGLKIEGGPPGPSPGSATANWEIRHHSLVCCCVDLLTFYMFRYPPGGCGGVPPGSPNPDPNLHLRPDL